MQITQKNRLSLLVATGLFCGPLQASGQSNWYAGLSAGCALTNQKITSTKDIQDGAPFNAAPWNNFFGKKNSKAKVNAGLFGGWGYKFANGFTVRGELSFSSIFGSQDAVRARTDQAGAIQALYDGLVTAGKTTAPNAAAYVTGQVRNDPNGIIAQTWNAIQKLPATPSDVITSVKRNFALSFAPQIGFTFCKNTFVFAEFGIGVAATDVTVQGVSAKYGAILFSPGAGIEYGFGNWRLGLKYNYEFSKSKTFGKSQPRTIQTQNHLINARISYAF